MTSNSDTGSDSSTTSEQFVPPQHLHVILRTCDRASISSDRIKPKDDCVVACTNSLITSLENSDILPWTITVIDDQSSQQTRDALVKIAPMAKFDWLSSRDDEHLSVKKRSRFSVAKAYDYIYNLPADDLVYIVEDDYLHYPNSMELMINAWLYFSEWNGPAGHIGIYPQDFPQLHGSPYHQYNHGYVAPCATFIGPDRYYRSTWYTQETFMLRASVFAKYREEFDTLLTIGDDDHIWEGNTISAVWEKPDVMMLMPMPTMCLHVSQQKDIPFYCGDFEQLWQKNIPSWWSERA